MKISAHVLNQNGQHIVSVNTAGQDHPIAIAAKSEGQGSSVNGGELLFLALATCYCNDIYREARKRNIEVTSVQVEVSGDFGAEGDPAQNIEYRASVSAKASEQDILDLMRHTDSVAEIQNTLRNPPSVTLAEVSAIPT